MKTRIIIAAVLCCLVVVSCGRRNAKKAQEAANERVETVIIEEHLITDGEHQATHHVVKTDRRSHANQSGIATPEIKHTDSLVRKDGAGDVMEEMFKGTLPAADGPGIIYDLGLSHQQQNNEGVYKLTTTYIEGENGKDVSFVEYGRYHILNEEIGNSHTEYIRLRPFDSTEDTNFIMEKDGSLTLLKHDMRRASEGTDLNYTLSRVK